MLLRKLPPRYGFTVHDFIGHQDGQWAWTGARPATYKSRSDVTRGFCGSCGTPMFYRSTRYPTETHFYAASFEHPEDVTPDQEYHTDKRLDWMPHIRLDR